MKTIKSLCTFVLFLLAGTSLYALVPPQFIGRFFEVNPNTRPTRIVLKYFDAVDKGFKVEVGKPSNIILAVDLKDGRRTICREYDVEGNLKGRYDLEYNEYGVLTKVLQKDKKENPQMYSVYTYANPKQENTLKEKKIYNSSDLKVARTEVYLRDKKGNVSTKKYLDANGNEVSSDNFTYNAAGKVEEELRKDANGNRRAQTDNSYDEEGRLVLEIKHDPQGKVVSQNKYTYNAKGLTDNIVIVTNEKTERYSVEYTYDERGNWIQQTVYKGVGRVPERILVRVITY